MTDTLPQPVATAFAFVATGMTLRKRIGDVSEPWQVVDWESVRDTPERVRAYMAEWECNQGYIVELTATLRPIERIGAAEPMGFVEPESGQRSLFAEDTA